MEITGYLVDWKEATKRMTDGTLESTMMDALNDGESWVQDLDWENQCHNNYLMVAKAWEAVRGAGGVPGGMDAKAQEFMNVLITHSDFCMDLGEGCEVIAISVSLESAARLAQAVAGVDFNAYRAAYHARCDQTTKEALGVWSEDRGVERGFEDGFLPYVQMWVDAVKAAARRKQGLLVRMG